MNCDQETATAELGTKLSGNSHENKLELARQWLDQICVECPDSVSFWITIFQVVTQQIRDGQTPIFNREEAMSNLYRLMAIIFGVLAALCIIGGIIAIIWSSTSPSEFNMFGVKLSTGHVGVAFVGIGMVTAYFTFSKILKHSRDASD